jgi:tellurite resistance protein TerC
MSVSFPLFEIRTEILQGIKDFMNYLSFMNDTVFTKPVWMWLVFFAVVLFLLALDLGVFNKKDHVIGISESLLLSAFYIACALLYSLWIWRELGSASSVQYLTGFLVEKTLAMDNIFVISMIFAYFNVPRISQHRVLFWGILGVIILRGMMICAGSALVTRFEWILLLFAAFLIYTGIKLLVTKEKKTDLTDNPVLRFISSKFHITETYHGSAFVVRSEGKLHLTPLLPALLMIEAADVIFAVDSVPAVFTITSDPYIVYTSNIFAILGLRALYFALAAMVNRFTYLKYALALVLIFIGSKVFIAKILNMHEFPPLISLGATLVLLTGGVVVSLIKTENNE